MDDRVTPELWFELCDLSDSEGETRAAELAAESGVERVTWWRNLVPDRTDLPRTLAEFTMLVVGEIGAGFVGPAARPGVRTLRWRRTARPGQGTISDETTNGLSVVMISPQTEAGAADLRAWGDLVHIRHIAEASVPGYRMITPYEVVGEVPGPGPGPRWLHLYEMVTPTPELSFKAMTPMVAARMGGHRTETWRRWATHPELVIDYVNTFALRGERRG